MQDDNNYTAKHSLSENSSSGDETVIMSRSALRDQNEEWEQEHASQSFVNLAEKKTKKKRGYVKSLIAGAFIILATATGGAWFYLNESARQASQAEKDYKMSFVDDKVYEYGKKVYLTPEAFVENYNDSDMPEGIKESLTVTSSLKSNGNKYTYNSNTGEVVSKGKKYLATGTYTLSVNYKVNGVQKGESISFKVEDTVAPEFTLSPKTIYVCQNSEKNNPANYTRAEDLNGVDYFFKPLEFDITKVGTYSVQVTAKDGAGNTKTIHFKMVVVSEEEVGKGATLSKNRFNETPMSEKAKKLKSGEISSDEETKKKEQEQKEAEEKAKAEEEKMKKSGWDGNKYYQSGSMVTGSQYIDGKWYYFDYGTGEKIINQWLLVNGTKTYYTSDGSRAQGFTEVKEGSAVNTYYFTSTGAIQTGWLTYNGEQYYFNQDGTEVFGETTVDGKIYTFDETSGALIEENIEQN